MVILDFLFSVLGFFQLSTSKKGNLLFWTIPKYLMQIA